MCSISVIMPVHNGARFLKKAVSCVLNQSFRDFELIIVDDSSDDSETLAYLESLKEIPNVRVVSNNSDRGAAGARNTGLDIAVGDYVIFLDSDDVFNSNLLEKLYLKITASNADICCCEFQNIVSRGDRILVEDRFTLPVVFDFEQREDLFVRIPACPWIKLIRTSFIKENNIGFQTLSSSNDVAFSLIACSLTSEIVFVNEPLVGYRVDNNFSISSKRDALNLWRAVSFAREELLRRGKNEDIINPQIAAVLMNGSKFEIRRCANKEINIKLHDTIRKFISDNNVSFVDSEREKIRLDMVNTEYDKYYRIDSIKKRLLWLVNMKNAIKRAFLREEFTL